MSLRLSYTPPRAPIAPAVDHEAALYELAAAGARGAIELDGYVLTLDGTGLVELAAGCRSLLVIIDGGAPAPADAQLRSVLPAAPDEAAFHQWLFSSWMTWIPALVFAVTRSTTWIATRTHAERAGWPLVVLEDRDLPGAVAEPTVELAREARAFLARCEADARAAPRT